VALIIQKRDYRGTRTSLLKTARRSC